MSYVGNVLNAGTRIQLFFLTRVGIYANFQTDFSVCTTVFQFPMTML